MEQARRSSTPELGPNNIKESSVRVKATSMPKLSLLSKLDRVTKFKSGRRTTVSSNLEGCQETEGDLHVKVFSDNPHARMETSAE